VPGSAEAKCRAGASGMVRRFALAPPAASSPSRGAGRSAVPGIAADPRARILGEQQERESACPSLPELAQQYRVNRDTLVQPVGSGGQLPGAPTGAARESGYKKLRSVAWDRAKSGGRSR